MWMQKNCSLVNTKIVMYKKMEWDLNCKRFVAFIDIAGFKAMVHNEEATKIATILSEFKLIADKQCEEYGMADMLYTIAVSDSIIIISKDDSEDSFSCFCQSLGVVFNNTLTSKLMTAAVAFGKMYVDRTNMIFFGEPYNIAYSLQEQMNYYGVLCDNSMSDYLKSRELPTHNDNFNFYKRLFMVIPSSLKKKTTSECKYCNEMKEKLNFKWFDMHFDPTHRFVEPDGIYVGTYFQRINSFFEREKLNVVHSKNKTMIEERIKNTEDMIGLFSTRELY